jgi:hypothetical protein
VTQTLTADQRDAFARDGVLKFHALAPADGVRRAREAVLRALERHGLWRDGAWRLDAIPRPQWPATGLKTSRAIGNKHPDIHALGEAPEILEMVAALLEGRPFDRAIHHRAQVLFTLPNAVTWTVPNGWHMDGLRLASGRDLGVQFFTFLDTVRPGGGGTVIVAGSHRLLNEGRTMKMKEIRRRLLHHPFFRELYADAQGRSAQRAHLMRETALVEGVELRLVELTGEPGDAYFTDLRALHSGAPNADHRPRIMLTRRFVREDVMQEMAEVYRWSASP